MFRNRQEYNDAIRDWIVEQNREGYGEEGTPGGVHGPMSCSGHPQAIFKAYFGEFEEHAAQGVLPACGYSEGLSGKLELFPEWAPWHGEAAALRIAFDPEDLDRHKDRWVATDGKDPRDQPLVRTAALLDVGSFQTPASLYTPLPLPEIRARGAGRWLGEVSWKSNRTTAWRARRDCLLILSADLDGPSLCIFTTRNLDRAHLRLHPSQGGDFGRRLERAGMAFHGTTDQRGIAIQLAEGEHIFIGSQYDGDGTVSGSIELNIGPPDMDTSSLDERIRAARREVPVAEVTESLRASPAGALDQVYGPLSKDLFQSINLHGDSIGRYGDLRYGEGNAVVALPQPLWREMLAVSKVDAQFYTDDQMCGDFSFDLRAEFQDRWDVNGVHIMLDFSAGPDIRELSPEQIERIPEQDLGGHAYCALLCCRDDGSTFFWFIEPQTDREVPPGAVYYRMRKGVIWMATAMDGAAADRGPDAPEDARGPEPVLPRRRNFVWLQHGHGTISPNEQFSVLGDDVTAADMKYPDVDHGLGGKPLPEWAEKALENDWGAAWWVDRPGNDSDPDQLMRNYEALQRDTQDALDRLKSGDLSAEAVGRLDDALRKERRLVETSLL